MLQLAGSPGFPVLLGAPCLRAPVSVLHGAGQGLCGTARDPLGPWAEVKAPVLVSQQPGSGRMSCDIPCQHRNTDCK